jgi:hypothetical protein
VEACGPTAVPPYEDGCQEILGFLGLLDRTLGVGGIVVGPILRPHARDGHLNSQVYLSDGLEA